MKIKEKKMQVFIEEKTRLVGLRFIYQPEMLVGQPLKISEREFGKAAT